MATSKSRYNTITSTAGSNRYNPIVEEKTLTPKVISITPTANSTMVSAPVQEKKIYQTPVPEKPVYQTPVPKQTTYQTPVPKMGVYDYLEKSTPASFKLPTKPITDLGVKLLNNPTVSSAMSEVSKRTSGTGIMSMIQANGPQTFQQVYDANRAFQAGDPSKLNQLKYQLQDTLPQTAIGVALNFVPFAGKPLSLAYWTALSASEQIDNKGKVESLNPIAIDVALDSVLGSSIEGLFKAPAKTLSKTVIQNFGVEGGTEVSQDLLKYQDAYLRAKTPEEKAKILADAKNYFTSGQIAMTGLVGGISGAAIGGGAYGVQKYQQMTPEEKQGGFIGGTNQPIDYVAELKKLSNSSDPQIATTANTYLTELNQSVFNPLDRQNVAQSMLKDLQPDMNVANNEIAPEQNIINNETSPNAGELSGELLKRGQFDSTGNLIKNSYNDALVEEINNKLNPPPQGPGYKKFVMGLEKMVKGGTLFPEDVTILKTLFENTDDKYLGSLNLGENSRFKNKSGQFSIRSSSLFGYMPETNKLQLKKGIAVNGHDASRVFAHEFGHAGYYMLLTPEERRITDNIYRQIGRSGAKTIFESGMANYPAYHAHNAQEFFAESFAEYVMSNKVPAKQMEPLLIKVAHKFFEGLKRLVYRGEIEAVNKIKPLFEKILKGQNDTPLVEFFANEPKSFKQELQKMFEDYGKTKEIPPQSIFPSGAVQGPVIEPVTPQTGETPLAQIEAIQQSLPPEIEVEPPQKVIEGERTTPLKQQVGWFDYLRTPWRVFEMMGIRPAYQKIQSAYEAYAKELPKNIDKITEWSKRVSPESNERIFRYLDGEDVALTTEEIEVAEEIKVWLKQWADRLGMKKDARISDYITHIFPLGKGGEIPEEIALLINKKTPKSVYNPFLLQRQGAEGYLKDTWKALDAYTKRATRKVHMDPALKELDEATAEMTHVSQLNYINKYVSNMNFRPTELDTSVDVSIKKIIGYRLGARPTATILRAFRQMFARSKIGLSITSLAKNITQGVNTFGELGTQYTARGYIDLVKFGAKELDENAVLISPVIEDQTYSAVKKWAEKADKVLFLNMNASETLNRGAAYYGAKAKFVDGKVTPKEFKQALGKEMPANYTPNLQDAIEYGKFVAGKTQFMFGPVYTPVGLGSDVTKTLFQFQTFNLKQSEFVIGMVTDRDWAKLIRYLIASSLVFAYIGSAFGMKWDESYKTFRFGAPPIWKFLYNDLFQQGALGTDKYGNKLKPGKRAKVVAKSLFTNVVPGGAQLNKAYEGISAVNQGHSDSIGNKFEYKIDKTPMNYVRASIFGKANLPQAKTFYDKKEGAKAPTTSSSRYNPI